MSFGGQEKPLPLWFQFLNGGLAGGTASAITQPVDLIKVHMQISGEGVQGVKPTFLGTTKNILKHEGVVGLYQGLTASLLRQFTYTLTRFGLYLKLKEMCVPDKETGQVPLYQKILSSGLAGAGGAIVGTPADIVMIRMQSDNAVARELRRNYRHCFHGVSSITQDEGVTRLWRGVGVNISRAILMTIGQLATYDQAKQMLLQNSWSDNSLTHFTASFIAAFVAAVITSPLDVSKTRIMRMKQGVGASYSGAMDCLKQMLLKEGPTSFYKGFFPYYLRLAPHTIISLIFYEQYAKIFRSFSADSE